jgi:hypothetical protein
MIPHVFFVWPPPYTGGKKTISTGILIVETIENILETGTGAPLTHREDLRLSTLSLDQELGSCMGR